MRRSKRHWNFETRVLVFTADCLLSCFLVARAPLHRPAYGLPVDPPSSASFSAPDFQPRPASANGRPIYKFSIIPGGASDARELVAALDRDPVAARHYAAFDRASLRTVVSPFSRPVYVSYRVGDSVYWTGKPLALKPGEMLLTDGVHYARTRCGNRVELAAQAPVRSAAPPADDLDDLEEPPAVPALAPVLPDMLPLPEPPAVPAMALLFAGQPFFTPPAPEPPIVGPLGDQEVIPPAIPTLPQSPVSSTAGPGSGGPPLQWCCAPKGPVYTPPNPPGGLSGGPGSFPTGPPDPRRPFPSLPREHVPDPPIDGAAAPEPQTFVLVAAALFAAALLRFRQARN